jgi:hypothetical protein
VNRGFFVGRREDAGAAGREEGGGRREDVPNRDHGGSGLRH